MTLPSKFGSVSRRSRISFLFLVVWERFRDHLCTDLVHSQIFSDNSPNNFFSYGQLIGNHPHSKTISFAPAASLAQCYPLFCLLKVFPDLWSSFTSSHPSLNRLCHSKHTRAWHGIITVHLLQQFQAFWRCMSCPAEQEISGWFSAQDSCREDYRATSWVQLPVKMNACSELRLLLNSALMLRNIVTIHLLRRGAWRTEDSVPLLLRHTSYVTNSNSMTNWDTHFDDKLIFPLIA